MSEAEEILGAGTDVFVSENHRPRTASENLDEIKKMESAKEMGRRFGGKKTPEEFVDFWLNRPNTAFDKKTPVQKILEGKAEEVKKFIESVAR